jgi:hypothetical protein
VKVLSVVVWAVLESRSLTTFIGGGGQMRFEGIALLQKNKTKKIRRTE